MKRSPYRVVGILLCSLLAAGSLYLLSRLNWIALPLGATAVLIALILGRASVWAVGLAFMLTLVGSRSSLPYYIDFMASRFLPLAPVSINGANELRGHYLLNSGFLISSVRRMVVEGDASALDDFQRRPLFYLPELGRGACQNTIVRITSGAAVVDTRCDDAAAPDK